MNKHLLRINKKKIMLNFIKFSFCNFLTFYFYIRQIQKKNTTALINDNSCLLYLKLYVYFKLYKIFINHLFILLFLE